MIAIFVFKGETKLLTSLRSFYFYIFNKIIIFMLSHTRVKYENNVVLHRLSILRIYFTQWLTLTHKFHFSTNKLTITTKKLHVKWSVTHESNLYIQNDYTNVDLPPSSTLNVKILKSQISSKSLGAGKQNGTA